MRTRKNPQEPVRLLVADPPWMFGDKLPGATRGAEKNYTCLTIEQIKAFPIPGPLAGGALLLLWRVSSMVEEAYSVCRAWGFTPKTEMVWVKRTGAVEKVDSDPTSLLTTKQRERVFIVPPLHFGMGRTLRAAHETCIVAHHGKFIPDSLSVRSAFEAPVGAHSEKPEAFYLAAEQLVQRGRRVELFARRRRPGWDCYGDELAMRDDLPHYGHSQ